LGGGAGLKTPKAFCLHQGVWGHCKPPSGSRTEPWWGIRGEAPGNFVCHTSCIEHTLPRGQKNHRKSSLLECIFDNM